MKVYLIQDHSDSNNGAILPSIHRRSYIYHLNV